MSKDKSKHHHRYKKPGTNIKAIRMGRGLSQEERAFSISSARNYVGCIERAGKFVSLAVIFDIADALNVKIEDLFKGL